MTSQTSQDAEDGDGTSLIDAYLQRRADLIRFFTVRLRSASAAEDLVQDIYVRLSTLESVPEVSNPVGYLYKVGSNLMLDRIRGERRTASREESWRDAHRTVVSGEEVDETPSAEQAVVARQMFARAMAALSDLPQRTQQVFQMHKFEGKSHPEVAAALGISRSSVEKHVMAALKHLSGRLK